jgi:hypothetical protein
MKNIIKILFFLIIAGSGSVFAAPGNSLLHNSPNRDSAIARYNKYERMQKAGFALLPVGAGAIAGGSYMIYKGTHNMVEKKKAETFMEKAEKNNGVVLASAGAALAFLGLAITSGGLVLGVSGTVRKNKFHQGSHGIYLKTTTKAVAIVYRF